MRLRFAESWTVCDGRFFSWLGVVGRSVCLWCVGVCVFVLPGFRTVDAANDYLARRVADQVVDITVRVTDLDNQTWPFSGRGLLLHADSDWVIVATALHVVAVPVERLQASIANPADLVEASVELSFSKTVAAEPKAIGRIDYSAVAAGLFYVSEQSARADAAFRVAEYGRVQVLVGDAGENDVAIVVLAASDLDADEGESARSWLKNVATIGVWCPREEPLDGSPPKDVSIFYSGEGKSVTWRDASTKMGREWTVDAGVCDGDSGGPVIREIQPSPRCANAARLMAVIREAPDRNYQEKRVVSCPSTFSVGKLSRLLESMANDPRFIEASEARADNSLSWTENELFSYIRFKRAYLEAQADPIGPSASLTVQLLEKLKNECACLNTVQRYEQLVEFLTEQSQISIASDVAYRYLKRSQVVPGGVMGNPAVIPNEGVVPDGFLIGYQAVTAERAGVSFRRTDAEAYGLPPDYMDIVSQQVRQQVVERARKVRTNELLAVQSTVDRFVASGDLERAEAVMEAADLTLAEKASVIQIAQGKAMKLKLEGGMMQAEQANAAKEEAVAESQ